MNALKGTPLTEAYAETVLFRLVTRAANLINLDPSQHGWARPTALELEALDALEQASDLIPANDRVWAMATAMAGAWARVPDPSPAQRLTMAAVRLREVLRGKALDESGDTRGGTTAVLSMAVGICAAETFGMGDSDVAALLPGLARQAEGQERGRAKLAAKADAWRCPLERFAIDYLARRKETKRRHGLNADILREFRKANPSVPLPGSDGPQKLVGKVTREHLAKAS